LGRETKKVGEEEEKDQNDESTTSPLHACFLPQSWEIHCPTAVATANEEMGSSVRSRQALALQDKGCLEWRLQKVDHTEPLAGVDMGGVVDRVRRVRSLGHDLVFLSGGSSVALNLRCTQLLDVLTLCQFSRQISRYHRSLSRFCDCREE
jgi:hypothetical protein